MRGVRQQAHLHQTWIHLTVAGLVAAAVSCKGERASSAASVDTTAQAAVNTTSTRTADTAPVAIHESTAAAVRDTTSPGVTQPTKTKKPVAAKPREPTVARTPPSDTTSARDTSTATTAKPDSQQAAAAPQDTTAPLRDPYHTAPVDTVAPVVYEGWKQFNLNCARCHGEDVLGTTIAPHLVVSLRPDGPINTKELFVQTVCAGRPAKGMPAWCSLGLGMDKINAIYSYVKGRSDGKIHPGRPAVRQEG
jgi:mono/diheme cytochrome c family protein